MGDPSEEAEEAPGWDAIDGALAPIYGDDEPKHYGTAAAATTGEDPLADIAVYLREDPPHFHFVTYGFTELWDKESDDDDTSGYGFELTFRLARKRHETDPPPWALHLLQNLARYVFRTGNAFAAGHKMGLNGPIAIGEDTALTAVCFAPDPELGEFSSVNGSAAFLQVVGITDAEYRLIQDWCTDGLVELLTAQSPLLITDLWRPSLLDHPRMAAELQTRIDRDGSSETSSFAGDLSYASDGSRVVMTLGALYAPAIRRAMLGRIRHRRGYQLLGRTQAIAFEPGEAGWRIVEGRLVLGVPPAMAKQIAAHVSGRAGRYDLAIPGVTLVVSPTYIRDHAGRVIEVKGVEGAQAEELAAAENAKLEPAAGKKPSAKAAAAAGKATESRRAAVEKAPVAAKPVAVKAPAAKQVEAVKAPAAAKQVEAVKASAATKPAEAEIGPGVTKRRKEGAVAPEAEARPAAARGSAARTATTPKAAAKTAAKAPASAKPSAAAAKPAAASKAKVAKAAPAGKATKRH